MAGINLSDNPKIFEMGYHAGFKDGVEGSIPREKIDEMIAEIGVCKTENEMRIAERDYKSRLWVSGIFSEVISIIHKYCDKEST